MTLQHHSEGPVEKTERVIELLRKFDTATLVTRTPGGPLHGRPMAIASVENDGTVWFVTDETSQKMAEIAADARVLVSLQSSDRFLTANGEVTIVKSQQKVRELWKESYKLWFDNENDPTIVLLRFTPEDAEYWDTSGIRGLKYAFRAAKAFLTGDKDKAKKETDPEVHGKVSS